jgi:4'-phosphopantetheinyl transferase
MEIYYIENKEKDFDTLNDKEKSFLPYYELNKICCIKQSNNRTLHFLSKWLLYQFVLEKGFPSNIIHKISYDRFQKPFLLEFPYHFSFSHSGEIAVLAVSSKTKVGIDIEQIPNSKLTVVPDIFSEKEKELLQNQPDITQYFYHIWTAKESIIKALGKGFDTNFKEMNIAADSIFWHNHTWFLQSCFIRENYICHIASNKKVNLLKIQELVYH